MKKHLYDLSKNFKGSFSQGAIVPVGFKHVIPGEIISGRLHTNVRFAPLNAPLYEHEAIEYYTVYGAYRNLWDEFEDFLTEPNAASTSVLPVPPTINLYAAHTGSQPGCLQAGELANFLGIPAINQGGTTANGMRTYSALPFRMYNWVCNWRFRDEDLQSPLAVSYASGADTTTNLFYAQAHWKQHFWNSLRPWPQKGPEISIPMALSAPVKTNNTNIQFKASGGTPTSSNVTMKMTSNDLFVNGSSAPSAQPAQFGTNTGLETDLTAAAGTLEQLRVAAAMKRYYENNMEGTRYGELMRNRYGVRNKDPWFQEPIVLGKDKVTMQTSEILQTAPNSDDGTSTESGVGQMWGHSRGARKGRKWKFDVPEFGIIMTFAVMRPQRPAYFNTVEKQWFLEDPTDLFTPELVQLGEQAYLCKEINADHTNQNAIFGFGPRYQHLRFSQDVIAGEFCNQLDYWTQARSLPNNVALNASFVTQQPSDRIFQSTASDQIYLFCRNEYKSWLPLAPSINPILF